MGKCVCSGAQIQCSFGTAPASLMTTTAVTVSTTYMPVATIMDFAPLVNIMPFGNCTTPSNPLVSAAFGAPQPCIPVTPAPWTPGSSTVKMGKLTALDDASNLMCAYGGQISVTNAGQTKCSMDN